MISAENKNKTEKLHKNFSTQIFNELDEEVESTLNRLIGVNKKITKFIGESNEMLNNINKKTNPIEICQYRKTKNILASEITKLFNDSKNLLEFKFPHVKKSAKEKVESIDKAVKSYMKQVSIYEKSVINSISSGITNKSIVLRRFNKFL